MSNLEVCPDCGHEVSKSAVCCPLCGAKRKAKCRSKKGGFISLSVAVAGYILCDIGKLIALKNGVEQSFLMPIGVVVIIGGLIAAAICFTAPAK